MHVVAKFQLDCVVVNTLMRPTSHKDGNGEESGEGDSQDRGRVALKRPEVSEEEAKEAKERWVPDESAPVPFVESGARVDEITGRRVRLLLERQHQPAARGKGTALAEEANRRVLRYEPGSPDKLPSHRTLGLRSRRL